MCAEPEIDGGRVLGKEIFDPARVFLAAHPVDKRCTGSTAVGHPAVVAAVAAFVETARHRRFLDHVVVGCNDYLVGVATYFFCPPLERFFGNRAGRVAAKLAAPDRRATVVAVGEHQEQDVADLERVVFPCA